MKSKVCKVSNLMLFWNSEPINIFCYLFHTYKAQSNPGSIVHFGSVKLWPLHCEKAGVIFKFIEKLEHLIIFKSKHIFKEKISWIIQNMWMLYQKYILIIFWCSKLPPKMGTLHDTLLFEKHLGNFAHLTSYCWINTKISYKRS